MKLDNAVKFHSLKKDGRKASTLNHDDNAEELNKVKEGEVKFPLTRIYDSIQC